MKTQNFNKITLCSVLGLAITGCATNSGTDALVGGAAGAGIGAALTRGHPGGAILGGALGAITGAAIGNQADREQAYREHYYYSYPPRPATYETRTIVQNPDGTTTTYISRSYGY